MSVNFFLRNEEDTKNNRRLLSYKSENEKKILRSDRYDNVTDFRFSLRTKNLDERRNNIVQSKNKDSQIVFSLIYLYFIFFIYYLINKYNDF